MTGRGEEFEELSSDIIGAAIELHCILGPGFVEKIYHNALKKELSLREISFETEKPVDVIYKGEVVGHHRVDLVVGNKIVVELKAAKDIVDAHKIQTLSYMKALGLPTGLVLNFGTPTVQIKRYVL